MPGEDIATEPRTLPRRHQLTLRTLMLLVLILALGLGWWVDHGHLKKRIPAQPQPSVDITITSLRNANAQQMVGAIKELFPSDADPPLLIASDPRTNSIMLRGTKEDLQMVEAILLKIETSKTVSDE